MNVYILQHYLTNKFYTNLNIMKKIITCLALGLGLLANVSAQKTSTTFYEGFGGASIKPKYENIWWANALYASPSPSYNPATFDNLALGADAGGAGGYNNGGYVASTYDYVGGNVFINNTYSTMLKQESIKFSVITVIGTKSTIAVDGKMLLSNGERDSHDINGVLDLNSVVTITGYSNPGVAKVATISGFIAPAGTVLGMMTVTGPFVSYTGFKGSSAKYVQQNSVNKLNLVSYNSNDVNTLVANASTDPEFEGSYQVYSNTTMGINIITNSWYNIGFFGPFWDSFSTSPDYIDISSNPNIMMKVKNVGSTKVALNIELIADGAESNAFNYTIGGMSDAMMINFTVPSNLTTLRDIRFRLSHFGTAADSANVEIMDIAAGFTPTTAFTIEAGTMMGQTFTGSNVVKTFSTGKVRVATVTPATGVPSSKWSVMPSSLATIDGAGNLMVGGTPGTITVMGMNGFDASVVASTIVTIEPNITDIMITSVPSTITLAQDETISLVPYYATNPSNLADSLTVVYSVVANPSDAASYSDETNEVTVSKVGTFTLTGTASLRNPAAKIAFAPSTFSQVVTVSSNVSVKNLVKSSDLSIYPNPATEEVNVRVANSVVKNVRILTTSGSVVLSKSFASKLSVSGFVPGAYIMEVSTDKGVARKLFTVK